MPVLIDHLERRLGRIDGGISVAGNSGDAPVSVARFRNGEIAKSVSYATIGLSNRPLRPRVPGKDLYMELIACEHEGPSGDDSLPRHLALIAQDLIDRNSALLRGDVFKFDTPLRPNSAMMGFYAALPVYFDGAFKSVKIEDGRHIAIVWLLPVGASEINFIEQCGFDEFENELVRTNPDLYDLYRPEIPLRIR